MESRGAVDTSHASPLATQAPSQTGTRTSPRWPGPQAPSSCLMHKRRKHAATGRRIQERTPKGQRKGASTSCRLRGHGPAKPLLPLTDSLLSTLSRRLVALVDLKSPSSGPQQQQQGRRRSGKGALQHWRDLPAGVVAVSHKWLLDCVGSLTVLPTEPYRVTL